MDELSRATRLSGGIERGERQTDLKSTIDFLFINRVRLVGPVSKHALCVLSPAAPFPTRPSLPS